MTPRRRKLTPTQKDEIRERQNHCCAICGDKLRDPIEWDHVRALALLGTDSTDNIQAVHAACHQTKTRGDMKAIAKAKRLERFMETGKHRNRKSRPIQSRGFDKSLRKRMDGTVERRRT